VNIIRDFEPTVGYQASKERAA